MRNKIVVAFCVLIGICALLLAIPTSCKKTPDTPTETAMDTQHGNNETENEKDKLIKDLLNLLQETRSKLRAKKDYDISDYIREKLKELGLNVEDK